MTRILGISAFYHDSAAALVRDGEIVAAAQEERFTRKKHDPRFPAHAIALLPARGRHRRSRDLDHVVFYDKPLVKFERLLETYLALRAARLRGRSSRRCRSGSRRSCYLKTTAASASWRRSAAARPAQLPPLLFTEHHESHAARAFYPSPVRARPPCSASTASASGRRPPSWTGDGNGARAAVGDRLPALARPAVLGVHLLHAASRSTPASTS